MTTTDTKLNIICKDILALMGQQTSLENDGYGNVKANSFFTTALGTGNEIDLGSFMPNTTKAIDYATNDGDAGFAIEFSSSPTQRVPDPDDDAPSVMTAFYDATNNSFLENKVLGQGHFWRLRFTISKLTNQTGGIEVRLFNTLSGFELVQSYFMADGATTQKILFLVYVIADDVSLPSPLGTGHGYNFEMSTFNGISLTGVIVEDITRVSLSDPRELQFL